MKKGWQTKTLGETCEVVNGGTPKTGVPEYCDGQQRWITPAEMGKRLKDQFGKSLEIQPARKSVRIDQEHGNTFEFLCRYL